MFVEDSDYIILSPGVRKDIAPVQWAAAKNIPVMGEVELGFLFCRAPIIAITGSNVSKSFLVFIFAFN